MLRRFSISTRFAVTAAILALLASDAVLLKANRNLAAARDQLWNMMLLPSGMHVPVLRGKSLAGQEVSVTYGIGRQFTLLLVYSPACPICEDNWDRWDEILSNVPSGSRIVAVDLSGLTRPDYIAAHNMKNFSLVRLPDPESLLAYRFRQTPETVVIDPAGSVVGSWIGALDRAAVREILATWK